MVSDLDYSFYRNKRVLVTGATGFKGSWLCATLCRLGADVSGYAQPPARESMFTICGIDKLVSCRYGDINDFDLLYDIFRAAKPEIVIHLAAQPTIREGYANPAYTYETNVIGTVNILECMRMTDSVRSFLNVTTDGAFNRFDWPDLYAEKLTIDNYDPYAVSMSCSELVTKSYTRSYFRNGEPAVSTARNGYVVGGGDFYGDRTMPEFIRAIKKGRPMQVKNPYAINPYQYVLDTLNAYLLIAESQYEDAGAAGLYNIGPAESDYLSAGAFADMLCAHWGEGAAWSVKNGAALNGKNGAARQEKSDVLIDCSKIMDELNWSPLYNIDETVKHTVEWYKAYLSGDGVNEVISRQIDDFVNRMKWSLVSSYH